MTNDNQDQTQTQTQTQNKVKRSECECECHQEDSTVNHSEPCCVPDTKAKGKDGKDYF